MILPQLKPPRPYRSTWLYRLKDLAVLALLALLLSMIQQLAFGAGGFCHIDPNTGQVTCGSGSQLPSMYGIEYLPIDPQQPWNEPRCVKLRNSIDGGSYAFLTGSIVSIEGDSSYVLSCSHGLGEAGDPVLVIFSDGRTLDIAKVVAVDRTEDVGLLKLLGGPRTPCFVIADAEPRAGERIFGGGFVEGDAWGGGYSQIDYVEAQLGDGRHVSCATLHAVAAHGQSGGPMVTLQSRLAGVIHSTDPKTGITYGVRLSRIAAFLDRLFPNRPKRLISGVDSGNSSDPGNLGKGDPAAGAGWQPATNPAVATAAASSGCRCDERFGVVATRIDEVNESTKGVATAVAGVAQRVDAMLSRAAEAHGSEAAGGFLAGLAGAPWLKVLAGAAAAGTGIGLPAAVLYGAKLLGSWAVGSFVRRRVGTRIASRVERVATPVAVDTPPPPPIVATERHYVPFEQDNFRRAHDWAAEQVVRKFPGATDIMANLDSLIRQQLAGQGPKS